MSDQLFVVLQVCLLALVYLVFLRVVRAVWVELRADQGVAPAAVGRRARGRRTAPAPPASAPAPAPPPVVAASQGPRLVVVAPAHLAGQAFALEHETTIGRGAGCGVPIDDAHVSKLHARVYRDGDGWLVEDLGSTNGTDVDGTAVSGPTPLGAGSRIRIGEVELELA